MKARLLQMGLSLAAVALMSAALAQERLNPVMLEQAIETEVSMISLVASADQLTVRSCSACASIDFKTDARTQYVLAGATLSKVDWIARVRNSPTVSAVVFYRLSDNFVSRVIVGGSLPVRR